MFLYMHLFKILNVFMLYPPIGFPVFARVRSSKAIINALK